MALGVRSGGRKIKVVGNGFDLIQRATMRVLPSTDEFSENTAPAEVSMLAGVGVWTVFQPIKLTIADLILKALRAGFSR